jgi:hypothetical protein
MAAVKAPPVSYRPDLPRRVIDSGALSDIQLEAIAAAGAAHEQFLPAPVLPRGSVAAEPPKRQGFVFGDGTGLGKGREISGVIMDNMRRGRTKAVWVSKNFDLFKDAVRDWTGIGGDRAQLFSMQKRTEHNEAGYKLTDTIDRDSGILFTTYSTTIKDSNRQNVDANRLDQLVAWLGEDFDGVIAFDEAHAMQNSLATKGGRGTAAASKQALIMQELRNRLPNSRPLYVTATAASDPNSLGYFDRLGLWGYGTPFANATNFVSEIKGGGVAAMELVARDLKAMGLMLSRGISFVGVGYDTMVHEITEEQAQAYNIAADMWSEARHAIEGAAEHQNEAAGGNSTKSTAAKMSQFWGGQQRFFNMLLTSMQMPPVIEKVRADLKAGRAPIIQLVNTNEAAQERELQKVADNVIEIDDFSVSPKQGLIDTIMSSFPVARLEEYADENGNIRTRTVTDANGNVVQDPELVERRDALVGRVAGMSGLPENPLDWIMEQKYELPDGSRKQGYDVFAEVTGRSRRVERRQGAAEIVSRSVKRREVEAEEFMDGKRYGLIFSQAGGTGMSYHADNTRINTAPRIHYVIQPGWRADSIVQGLGRSHRSNQKQPPFYWLTSTNIAAHRRFLSTAARRLGQLGALSKGQRQTGGGGFLSEDYNLENEYAEDGLRQFASDAHAGRAGDITLDVFEEQTGIRIQDKEGNFDDKDLNVKRFLNRLLSMRLGMQDQFFGHFIDNMHRMIDEAKEAGTYDSGMEILEAERIDKMRDETVRVDERTGAETRYVKVRLTEPRRFRDFSDAVQMMASQPHRFRGFWHNARSGKIAAMFYSREKQDDRGRVETLWSRVGIDQDVKSFTEESTVNNARGHWREVADAGEARNLWNQEIADTQKHREWTEDYIVGSILPIWDRLQGTGRTRVKKMSITDTGESLLGRFIPEVAVGDVLRRLGIETGGDRITVRQAVSAILSQGARYELSNGWILRDAVVSRERRIEIVGPENEHEAQLRGDGAFTEIVGYKKRFFVPADAEAAIPILERITQSRPIVEKLGQSESQGMRFSLGEAEPTADARAYYESGEFFMANPELRTQFERMAPPGEQDMGDLVDVQVDVEGGATSTVRMPLSKALQAYDSQIESLDAALNCLGRG